MIVINKWWQYCLLAAAVVGLSTAALMAIAAMYIYPRLPDLEVIADYKPKLPLRIYSQEGLLIGEFGKERRDYVKIEQIPKIMKDAVLAIEDRRFYQHHGIDFKGLLRAIKNNVTGISREGASTITMQVAKNFFSGTNSRRTIEKKINEALLSIKIERNLTKNKILELYLNQIYLGQRSYGFAAAAKSYFGKSLNELSLAETALLAGLPKAPSGYNPYTRRERALGRQREVLRDMYRFGFIDEQTYLKAKDEELTFKKKKVVKAFKANYVAEMVRDQLYRKYKDAIYVNGLQVYTTINIKNQEAANDAIRDGLINYDLRHGFRGVEKHLDLSKGTQVEKQALVEKALKSTAAYNGLLPAVVTAIKPKQIEVITKKGGIVKISGKGLKLVSRYVLPKKKAYQKKAIQVGDVLRVLKRGKQWTVVQLPQVQAAMVAVDPSNGAVRALVGGFDFNRSKFNHATQAWRQPGSSFKPFVYSAALEKGYTPATIIEDEEIEFTAEQTGDEPWKPQNYDHQYRGPIRLREGLAKSVNTIAIRMLDNIGVRYTQDYVTRFGFSKKRHPAFLTMALGAGSSTPWQMAGGYAVFANGGYQVPPYIVDKILDQNGRELFVSKPPSAGESGHRVIDERNAFLMTSMLKTVVKEGTGRRAMRLGRKDLAGKTGTTNDHYDAWFAGFNPDQVAVVWMGYDQPRSLGARETGGGATLPIWTQYMGKVLKGIKEKPVTVPEGIMKVKIDLLTGTKDSAFGQDEYFYEETPPPEAIPDVFDFDEENGDLIEFLQNKARGFFRDNGGQPPARLPQHDSPLQPGQNNGMNPVTPPQAIPEPATETQVIQIQRSRPPAATRPVRRLPVRPEELSQPAPTAQEERNVERNLLNSY